jgi:hypothetical protein
MRGFLSLVLLFGFACNSYADLYVVVDKNTKEVITVSEKNDTIPAEGQEVKVLKGSLKDFSDENPTNYKLSGTKFVKDIEKISNQELKKAQDEENAKKEVLIKEKTRQMAIEALKLEGKLDDSGNIVK